MQGSQPVHPDTEAEEMRRNIQRKQSHFVEASSSEETSYDTAGAHSHSNAQGLSFASSPADAAAAVAKMGAASMTPANDSVMASLLPSSQNVGEDITAEMKKLYKDLQKCLELREKYMDISLQGKWQDNPKNWDAEYCHTWAKEKGKSKPGDKNPEPWYRNPLINRLLFDLQWIPANWTWDKFKPVIRGTIVAFVSVLLLVIMRAEIAIGNVSFRCYSCACPRLTSQRAG